jgi:prephenate dehydratase
VFRIRNLPAALHTALGGLTTNGVNMTKIEIYMMKAIPIAAAQPVCGSAKALPDRQPLN